MSNFKPFSKKQMMVLTWWCASNLRPYDAVICDGAVRSGKTLCMSISFVSWAFARFDAQAFAICGKTVTSLRRNVITPLLQTLHSIGFACEEKVSRNYVEISYQGRSNRFYLFGGRDESSAALIQGITLAGVMLDEVALMPRSFVEQALARCSVSGSKFWFNCNPDHPFHWFYLEWIQKAEQKNALYLHFQMSDNPSLTKAIRARYAKLYSGAFYDRFVLGKWTSQAGLVYPAFDPKKHVVHVLPVEFSHYYLSCDYGITNPASFGLWGQHEGRWYRMREYYYDSKEHHAHKTDEEYYAALVKLAGQCEVEAVIVDPSASSFMETIRRHGRFRVIAARNDVINGINCVADALEKEKLLFSDCCQDALREFALYAWDDACRGDSVKKVNDHAMDDIRYFVYTVLKEREDDFFVLSAARFSDKREREEGTT